MNQKVFPINRAKNVSLFIKARKENYILINYLEQVN
jgi:hypothetical protein